MNRAFSEAGWPDREDGTDRLGPAYVRHLYGVLDRLRADHRRCGSRRAAVAAAASTWAFSPARTRRGRRTTPTPPTGWGSSRATARSTRPHDGRLGDRRTQPAHRPYGPAGFRFHVAMAGALGIGGDLTHWSEEELREGADLVATYKKVRHLVQHGRLDRLSPPAEDSVCVVQYTAPDASETLLLAYRRVSRHGVPRLPVRPRGLTPGGRYRDARTGAVHHSTVLGEYGIDLELPGGRLVQHGGASRPGGLTPRPNVLVLGCLMSLSRRGPVEPAGPSPGPGSAGVGWAVC